MLPNLQQQTRKEFEKLRIVSVAVHDIEDETYIHEEEPAGLLSFIARREQLAYEAGVKEVIRILESLQLTTDNFPPFINENAVELANGVIKKVQQEVSNAVTRILFNQK